MKILDLGLIATVVAAVVASVELWVNRRRVHLRGQIRTHHYFLTPGRLSPVDILHITVSIGAQPVTLQGFSVRVAADRRAPTGRNWPTGYRSGTGHPERWPDSDDGVRVEAGTVATWTVGQVRVPSQYIDVDGTAELVVSTLLPRLAGFRRQPTWWMKFSKRLYTRRSMTFRGKVLPLEGPE